jgi:hypothetical protein
MDKKINILILVLSEKKILNETKNHNPLPCKLNGRSLICETCVLSNCLLLNNTYIYSNENVDIVVPHCLNFHFINISVWKSTDHSFNTSRHQDLLIFYSNK